MTKTNHSAAILGNFDMSMPGPNGATLRITGYMYEGDTDVDLNGRMDACRKALQRQQEILEKPVLEARVKMLTQQEDHVAKAYLELMEKSKHKTINGPDAAHLKNYPEQLKQLREEIVKGEAALLAIKSA